MYHSSRLSLLFILFSVLSCQKYEDGPKISLKSAEARLTNDWKVQVAYFTLFTETPENGENQTELWKNLKVVFKDDKTYTIENFNSDFTEKTIEEGSWEFLKENRFVKTVGVQKTILIESGAITSTNNMNTKWRIMRLKKNELWVWYQNQTDPPWIYFKFNN